MVDPPRFPSLSSIRAFEAAARCGGFAQAARELGTSAASVSYHVRQLELQIGVVLFQRSPQRVDLTQAGALVAREATAAFSALRASFSRAVDLDGSRLSVSALPTFGSSWLTPRLDRFCQDHPNLRVDLDVSVEAQDLSAGVFDVAIRKGHGKWPGLRAVELFPSVFQPLCAPSLLAATAGLRNGQWTLDVPLLGRPDWWDLWFRAAGRQGAAPLPVSGLNLSNEHLDAVAAIAGHGVAIGSPILLAREIEAGQLVPAHDLLADDGRPFWLTYPASRRHSPKIVAFEAWLRGEAAEAAASARRRRR